MKNNYDLYFTCFSNVRFTKGHNRSLLVDLFTGYVCFVPNALVEILENSKFKTINDFKENYSTAEFKIILEYLNFLDSKNLIYFGSKEEIECFIVPELDFSFPSDFIDSIIEVSNESKYDLKNAILKCEELNVRHIEFRFLDSIDLDKHLSIIEVFSLKSNFETFKIIIPYTNEILDQLSDNLFIKVKTCIVYNCPDNYKPSNSNIIVSYQNSISANECGNVNQDQFIYNTEFFAQSKNCNTCLSHKLSINFNGQIVNCPASKKEFGSIEQISKEKLLNNLDFTSIWKITKDEVEICKDCEFRNVCMDCRFIRSEEESIYSKPLKCSYNPYSNTWG